MPLPEVTVIAVFKDIEDEATKQAIYSAEQSVYHGEKHLILMCTMYAEGQTDFSMFVFAAIQAETEYVALMLPGDNWETNELENWMLSGESAEHFLPMTYGSEEQFAQPIVWNRDKLLEEHGAFWLDVLSRAEQGELN